MKKISLIIATVSAATILAGCAKELDQNNASPSGSAEIIATATAPGVFTATKVMYNDNYSEAESIADITAAWESGDSFTALEINGEVITKVKFTTTGTGANAVFKSDGAVAADENTIWLAVSGNTSFEDGNILCKYDNQDGSLNNLGNYAYSVAEAKGNSPVFDFSKGKKLSYVMRLLLPQGIKYVEFNTGTTYEGGWSIASADKIKGTSSTTDKEAVKTIELPSSSSAKQIIYLVVPAINYVHSSSNRTAGIIVTIFSGDKKTSQGKATSPDLTDKGGCIGTFDMSSLTLIPRPLPSEAIRLGSVKYDGKTYPLGSWAPYNLGGDEATSDEAINGWLYAWGETEPRTAFAKETYKWYDSGTYTTQLGYKNITAGEGVNPYIVYYPSGIGKYISGSGTFYDIGGTKFDAARVKWGSDWRLPANDISGNILKVGSTRLSDAVDTGQLVSITWYAPGTYTNRLNYKSSALGAVVIKANNEELALYLSPFTDTGSIRKAGTEGRYWTATSDYGVNNDPTSGYWNRALQLRLFSNEPALLNNKSYQWDGLSIRPVLNE